MAFNYLSKASKARRRLDFDKVPISEDSRAPEIDQQLEEAKKALKDLVPSQPRGILPPQSVFSHTQYNCYCNVTYHYNKYFFYLFNGINDSCQEEALKNHYNMILYCLHNHQNQRK